MANLSESSSLTKQLANHRKKVVVAMSGGIDSSVAAVLLKRAGFDVVGVFMKFWAEPGENGIAAGWNRCCSLESEKRARRVASMLGIPFYVFNFEKEFKKRIVDYFLAEYKVGRTPNPCVTCNKEIKFGLLLDKSLALRADYVATGHYVKKGESKKTKSEKLFRAKDKEKDQSYFLWQLNQSQLKRILFPLAGYSKKEVKKLAKKFNLPFAKVQESMEICFVRTTVNDFLKRHLKPAAGIVVGKKGEILGKHEGIWHFTIGQRKGLGLAGGAASPWYVLDKDLKINAVMLTQNKKDLLKKETAVKMINWISGQEPKLPLRVMAKIRYRHKSVPAVISKKRPGIYTLKFSSPQSAVTPGQSAVFYRQNELLGGGIIC